jgi:uncharacterized membrane protein
MNSIFELRKSSQKVKKRLKGGKMVKKKVSQKTESSKSDSKTFAFLATFLSIVGFIIALLTKKEDKYVMFYAKQSLVLFIAIIIGAIIRAILIWIPIIGPIINVVICVFLAILWIMSWIYALSGEEKEIPYIGKYARKLNL